MAIVSPNTVVYLLNVPIEKDQKNQMDFASATAQANYFLSKVVPGMSFTANDFTYQRKDNVIRIGKEFDSVIPCNYVMYKNSYYNNKWFYAFIDRIEYVNPNLTNVYIKTDVFQTYQFDWTLEDSFVAREHVANDTLWAHTLPEPTPTPEYTYTSIYNKFYDVNTTFSGYDFDSCYCIGVYATPNGTDPSDIISVDSAHQAYATNCHIIGGIPGPGYLFSPVSYGSLDTLIALLVTRHYEISYTVVIPLDTVDRYSSTVANVYIIHEHGSVNGLSGYSNINTKTINGHTIKNNKLNCYPYRYITMTDHGSQKIPVKYELMTYKTVNNNQIINIGANFVTAFAGGSAPTYTLACTSYAGRNNDWSNSITVTSFPPCPYSIATYTQYTALHKNAIEVERERETFDFAKSIGSSAVQIITGTASGNVGGVVSGIMEGISGQLDHKDYIAKYNDMKAMPPKVFCAPKGSAQIYWETLGFQLFDTAITAEYAEIMDDYFDRYGYNVSIVKTPNYKSRQKWNYIETKDINIKGNIPQEDMQELKHIFNNGITIWHGNVSGGTENWCNYAQTNPTVNP